MRAPRKVAGARSTLAFSGRTAISGSPLPRDGQAPSRSRARCSSAEKAGRWKAPPRMKTWRGDSMPSGRTSPPSVSLPMAEILSANPLFLAAVGYSADELVGKHHRIFCDEDYQASAAYVRFGRNWPAARPSAACSSACDATVRRSGWRPPISGEECRRGGRRGAEDRRRRDPQPFPNCSCSTRSTTPYAGPWRSSSSPRTARYSMPTRTSCVSSATASSRSRASTTACSASTSSIGENPDFWARLRHGEFSRGHFERRSAAGERVHIEATYNPVKDSSGG